MHLKEGVKLSTSTNGQYMFINSKIIKIISSTNN